GRWSRPTPQPQSPRAALPPTKRPSPMDRTARRGCATAPLRGRRGAAPLPPRKTDAAGASYSLGTTPSGNAEMADGRNRCELFHSKCDYISCSVIRFKGGLRRFGGFALNLVPHFGLDASFSCEACAVCCGGSAFGDITTGLTLFALRHNIVWENGVHMTRPS